MAGMKRLARILTALGIVGCSAFVAASAQAYQPVDAEEFFADPSRNAPGASFDAVVTGCFPGEPVVFTNLGITPNETATTTCGTVVSEARVTFVAPTRLGSHEMTAFLAAQESDNPDIPDRPERLLTARYVVSNGVVAATSDSGGGADRVTEAISTGGSGDVWPSFISSSAFYRTFLGLLALMAGLFFVWLWRRRREDERLNATHGYGAMAPPDTNNPSIA